MKNVIIALHFRSYSAPQQTVFADKVIASLTGNTAFPSPYPTVAMLTTKNADLKAAIASASLGGLDTTADVYAKQRELLRNLKAIAAYVEFESNTNEVTALSSGFDLKQSATKIAKSFSAKHGILSGTADLETKAGSNCGYIWHMCLDPLSSNDWVQQKITMQSKTTLTGLTPGVKYWFRVALITKDGQQSWSDPYMLLVV